MKQLGEPFIEKCDDGKNHLLVVELPPTNMAIVSPPQECFEGLGYDKGIRDLGPVNGEGCLPNPWNKNKYPTIYSIGDGDEYEIEWIVESDNVTTHVRAYGKTRQQAIDAWNQRA